MAKRIQDFREFNSSREETFSEPKKAKIVKQKSAYKKTTVKKNVSKNKQNEKQKEKTKGNKFVTVFFVILVFLGVGIGCLFSPTFNLAGIIVNEGVNIKASEILNSFSVEMGTNVFKIDYNSIENLVEELPYIQTATAKLDFPNEIKIDYIERKPHTLVKYLESYLVMDKYGYILEINKEKKFNDLPIIYNIHFDEYEIGKQLQDTAKTKYDNVMYLLENVQNSNFEYTISEINYESIGNVKIWVAEEDVEIIYGAIDRNVIVDKLNYISAILNKVSGKGGRIDVSSEDYLEKTVFTERL